MKIEQLRSALKDASPLSMADVEYIGKGYHLELALTPQKLADAVAVLDREGFFIEALTGVDWPVPKVLPKAADAGGEPGEAQSAEPLEAVAPLAEDEMEVVYDFNHYSELCRVALRVRVPRDKPGLPSISAIYPGADWHERETHEFFGIVFEGHPDLKPLLLPEDADFHPLRKDFAS